jgi:hypothetical protein
MRREVSFALGAGGESWITRPPASAFVTPWAERRTVTLTVTESDRLRKAYADALAALGVVNNLRFVPVPWYIVLHDENDAIDPTPRGLSTVPVPQGLGPAQWKDIDAVTYRDLIVATHAGLIRGDPARHYLFPASAAGCRTVAEWDALLSSLKALKVAIDVFAAPGAVYATLTMLRTLRAHAIESAAVISQKHSQWMDVGADPLAIEQWLDDGPWHADDLAVVLGCSRGEAEAVLWAFGFAQAPSGLWRRGATEEAKLLAGNRLFEVVSSQERRIQALTGRLRVFAETKQAPDDPSWEDLE